jgi:UDP-2-acetamido-2-deoxy-ribo-hexuluronate aminotransferase
MRFIDLQTQYGALKEKIDRRIQNVLNHGQFIMGPEVGELEERLADFTGSKYAISCSSGTDALLMPLMAKGIGKGDAVFTSVFTFFATAEVIALTGATPVFVDIRRDTFNIDSEKLEEAIVKTVKEGRLNPRMAIPVDLFGLPADYGAITEITRKYGLYLLEDAAQGFGGRYRGKTAGSFGDAAATSFFPAKPLGCYGDGGAVFTDDGEMAETLKSIRIHGQGTDRYENVRLGINGRMDTIQAAVLLEKLAVFQTEIEKRNEIAAKYTGLLKDCVATPAVPDGMVSTWAQYSVLARDGDEKERIRAALQKEGIPTAVYYPIPLHLQKAFLALGYREGDFPAAEDAASRIFSLPMHAYLNDEEIGRISRTIANCVGQGRA